MTPDTLHVLDGLLTDRSARGLAQAVGTAVGSGDLIPGHRLPPVRTMATGLGVSPSTVSAAWGLLSRAGTISTDGRRGTVIAAPAVAGPRRYRRALDRAARFDLDLSTGVPDPALLPDLRPALSRLRTSVGSSSYLDPPTLPALAEVVRPDLPFAAEAVTITDGAMDGIELALRELVRFGDRVVVETPGFAPLLDLLDSLGARTVGVGIDDQGLRPDLLAQALRSPAAAVVLQPGAQNPTGASMTADRADRLAQVLSSSEAWVIEDDSAGSIAATPALSLGGALPDRVVHVRSFSKSHGPDLRLAVLAGPAGIVERLVERRHLGQGWSSRLLQQLLLDLLTDPGAVAQVDAARVEYARRRGAVVGELRRHGIDLPDGDGLNLWLPVQDEAAAMVSLASRSIGVAAGSPFRIGPEPGDRPGGHVRVTVGLIADDHAGVAALLAEAAGARRTAGLR